MFGRKNRNVRFTDKKPKFLYAAGTVRVKDYAFVIRSFFIKAAVFGVFVFSVNLVVQYIVEKNSLSFNFRLPELSASGAKYLILKGNYYALSGSGRTELVDSNIDRKPLPVLTGVELDEKRPEYKEAIRQALKIDRKYTSELSEIVLRDPKAIMAITVDGVRIDMGDSLTNEKFEAYFTAAAQHAEAGKKHTRADLTYNNRVILK